MNIEEKIDEVHSILKELFPNAVAINIRVTYEGINASPEYRTNAKGYSMRTVKGDWIRRAEE